MAPPRVALRARDGTSCLASHSAHPRSLTSDGHSAHPRRWVGMSSYAPSYNVTPGAPTPVLRADADGSTVLHTMRWGLVPAYTKRNEKPDFYRMFNARSETVSEKPVFGRLVGRQRCAVLSAPPCLCPLHCACRDPSRTRPGRSCAGNGAPGALRATGASGLALIPVARLGQTLRPAQSCRAWGVTELPRWRPVHWDPMTGWLLTPLLFR